MIFSFSLLLAISAVLTISYLGTHYFMGYLRLVLEVLLFTSCALRCEFDSFWLISTLGLAPFGFDSHDTKFLSLQNLDLWGLRVRTYHCLRLRVLWLWSNLSLIARSFRFWLNHSFKFSTFRYKEGFQPFLDAFTTCFNIDFKIGRASCRERV